MLIFLSLVILFLPIKFFQNLVSSLSKAKSRFSLTVKLLNNLDCWNKREMPRLEIFSGLAVVTSLSKKMILPLSSFKMPDIKLKTVDLPAPLGPIKAVIVFSSTSKEQLSTAFTPPKYFLRFLTFSILFLH